MTTDTYPSLTVRTFLLGDADDRAQVTQLAHALDEQGVGKSLKGVIGNLSDAGCQAVDGELARMANGMLNGDLGTLVVAAWCKWRRLVEAARETAAEPGRAELVTLDEQRIVFERRPRVEVLVDEQRVATVTFVLTLEFIIKALVAVVRHGRLVAVNCASTVVVGTFAVEGCPQPVKQCRRTVDLPLVVNLGAGIPLLT